MAVCHAHPLIFHATIRHSTPSNLLIAARWAAYFFGMQLQRFVEKIFSKKDFKQKNFEIYFKRIILPTLQRRFRRQHRFVALKQRRLLFVEHKRKLWAATSLWGHRRPAWWGFSFLQLSVKVTAPAAKEADDLKVLVAVDRARLKAVTAVEVRQVPPMDCSIRPGLRTD